MSATAPISDQATCPCRTSSDTPSESTGSSDQRRSYANCCKPLHTTGFAGLGATPETTMRSRYTAYVCGDENYLLATWDPTTRPESVDFSTEVEWHGLTVISATGSGLDRDGTVEFRARFRRGDAHLELHELSTFAQRNGRWFYVEGTDPGTV